MPSTRAVEKSWNFQKFDLWPAITGLNIDLSKIIPPIASTRREQSAGLFREALRRFVWKRQGGVAPPPTPAKVAKHGLLARVNPRLTGGGGVWRPSSRIFAIAQKRTALSTWNLTGLLIQQFDIVREHFVEIRRTFLEIWSILWRHYTPLLVENWPNFAGLWKTQFLMKTQMENIKRRKMRSSTRWLSRFFSKFWVFDP